MWTIYIPGTDVTLFNAIFNGVAMLCNQTSFIWGFAILASFYHIFSGTTAAAMHSPDGSGGAKLANASMSAFIPLLLAMCLTVPGLKTRVQVETTFNGVVTVIDNVPMVIAIIPVAGSTISTNAAQYVNTAFQNVGTNYPALSASSNGFLNPLKALLSARSTVTRLRGVQNQIATLVHSCVTADSGLVLRNVLAEVRKAGRTNSGATSLSNSALSIQGIPASSIGMLLYQASLNTTGTVNFSSAPNSVLSCADGANSVAQEISSDLGRFEFASLTQGAINGMDTYQAPGTYDLNTLSNTYSALRTSNTVVNNLAGGQTQANTEMLNLLFAELVDNQLNCIGKDADLAQCSSAMLQANEIERANILSAASEVPMLKYAGSFGSQLLALIIGLSPLIVMFMMFSGLGVARSGKVVAHIIVWPMLVMSVGAELVNGIICINVAKFIQNTSGLNMLIHDQAASFYKELSLQIGTGSHIMASLPVLMGTIFSLGAASAIAGTMRGPASSSEQAANAAAPKAVESAPLVSSTSVATAKQGTGFNEVSMTGSLNAVAGSANMLNATKDLSKAISTTETRQNSLSEGKTNLAQWQQAFQSRDYSSVGVDFRTGEDVRKAFEHRMSSSYGTKLHERTEGNRQNSNNTALSAGISGGLSAGSKGFGGSVGINASGKTQTSAADTFNNGKGSGDESSFDKSKALSEAASEVMAKGKNIASGKDYSKSLGKTASTQSTYQSLLSDTRTSSDSVNDVFKSGSSFQAAAQNIGSTQIAHQMNSNDEFRKQQLLEGRNFESMDGASKYMDLAKKDMESGSTERLSDPQARDAAVRWHAATIMASDQNASSSDRLTAYKYLASSAKAMNHMGIDVENVQNRDYGLRGPRDTTGVDDNALIRKANQLDPSTRDKPKPTTHRKAAPKKTSDSFGDRFKYIELKATPDGSSILNERLRQKTAASNAGLDPNGPGTVVRTGKNLVDNVEDIGRTNGVATRTNVGNIGTGSKK